MQLMAAYEKEINNVRNDDNGIKHYSKEEYVHKLRILKDTLLYDIIGEEEIEVNSRHNYHIDSPGIHKVSAYSEDGIIEAIENESKTFQLGVQWHPESLDDIFTEKIFEKFIDAANKYHKVK
jgi:putative glutamine amidotransferase